MKRYIRSAEETKEVSVEDQLNDALGALKDDFNFVIDGIEKIAADGNFSKASEIANGLSEMINASIEEMAEAISAED